MTEGAKAPGVARSDTRRRGLWAALALGCVIVGCAAAIVVLPAVDPLPDTLLGPSGDSTPGRLGCVSAPSRCGYPDATNTGVAHDHPLVRVPSEASEGDGWRFDERGWISVFQDGAVLEDVETAYPVDVTAHHATLRNLRITASGEAMGVGLRSTRGVTISDCEIGPPDGANRLTVGIKDVFGDAAGTSVLRTEITGTSTGVQLQSGLIQDSFIHSMGIEPGDHVNGVTSNGSSSELRIVHNTILNRFDQTDAIGLFQDFGVEANRTIVNNLLAGGSYTVYGGANPDGAPTSGIRISGNRFSRLYYPNGGAFGPVAAFDPAGVGNVWADNIWDDTGEEIRAPSP